MLEVVLHRLEAHEGMGAHGMTGDSRGGAYVNAVRLARGRSYAIPPWPYQETDEAKYWVVNEALAIYVLAKVWHRFSFKFQ